MADARDGQGRDRARNGADIPNREESREKARARNRSATPLPPTAAGPVRRVVVTPAPPQRPRVVATPVPPERGRAPSAVPSGRVRPAPPVAPDEVSSPGPAPEDGVLAVLTRWPPPRRTQSRTAEGEAPFQVVVKSQELEKSPSQDLLFLQQPPSPVSADFRAMRHRIVQAGRPHIIMVTAAGPKSGKTFCAANIALALAEPRDSHVLLVDANVRNPQLASLFKLRDPECLCDQLEQHVQHPGGTWKVDDASIPSLHLLAIAPPGRPRGSLDVPTFNRGLALLGQAYEFVVIDCPPVGDGPEADLLSDICDAIVLAASAGDTKARKLREAADHLPTAKILGVVLCGV